jgi:hypothetical protein
MALLPVQLVPPTLADGYCPGSLQEFTNDIISATTIQSSISTDNIVISDTAPADTTKIWFKTVGGLPSDPNQFYKWNPSLGLWVRANSAAASGNDLRLFEGTIGGGGDLETYDGGSAGVVGDASGPMWEEATEYRGRSPMGVGAIPTANPAKSLALAEDFGEGAHLQTTDEVGSHKHEEGIYVRTSVTGYWVPANGSTASGTGDLAQDVNLVLDRSLPFTANNTYGASGQQTMPVVHPVRGVYFIRRTARIYYVG